MEMGARPDQIIGARPNVPYHGEKLRSGQEKSRDGNEHKCDEQPSLAEARSVPH